MHGPPAQPIFSASPPPPPNRPLGPMQLRNKSAIGFLERSRRLLRICRGARRTEQEIPSKNSANAKWRLLLKEEEEDSTFFQVRERGDWGRGSRERRFAAAGRVSCRIPDC